MTYVANIHKSSVIDEQYHDRLLQNLEGYAADANILPEWVGAPLKGKVPDGVVGWVKNIKTHDRLGLVLASKGNTDMQAVCSLIAGALLRNYVAVKVMPLSGFILASDSLAVPRETCVLIPNFFSKGIKNALPAWKKSILLDGLVYRDLHGLKTVLVVDDVKAACSEYGSGVRCLIETSYETQMV